MTAGGFNHFSVDRHDVALEEILPARCRAFRALAAAMSPSPSPSPPCRSSPSSARPSITAAPIRSRPRMQTALDSTALMLSKEAATDTEHQLQGERAQIFHGAVHRGRKPRTSRSTSTYTTDGGSQIVISATATMPGRLHQAHRLRQLHRVVRSSTAKWGYARGCASRWCSTTPDRWPTPARWPRCRPRPQGLLTPAAGRREHRGRRLCLDHSVREGRQPRRRELEFGLGLLGQQRRRIRRSNPTSTSWDALNGVCTSNTAYNNNREATASHAWRSCSNTSYTHAEHLHDPRHLQRRAAPRRRAPATRAGTCSISGNNTQSTCTSAGTCSLSGYTTPDATATTPARAASRATTTQSSCQSAHICSSRHYTSRSTCQNNSGTWTAGVWTSTPGTWTAGVWTPPPSRRTSGRPAPGQSPTTTPGMAASMDRGYPASPSTLGGLSGPDTTYNFDTNADPPDPVTPRCSSLYAGRAVQLVPAGGEAAELRLDRR